MYKRQVMLMLMLMVMLGLPHALFIGMRHLAFWGRCTMIKFIIL